MSTADISKPDTVSQVHRVITKWKSTASPVPDTVKINDVDLKARWLTQLFKFPDRKHSSSSQLTIKRIQ